MLKIIILVMVAISFLGMLGQADALIIYLRPNGVAESNWTSGSFSDINESLRDDGDYIVSRLLKQVQTDRVAFSLDAGRDPIVDVDHYIRYTFKENGLGDNSPYLIVRLKEGTTVIESWIEPSPLPITFTQKDYLISDKKIAQITSYENLRVEFEAVCSAAVCTNDNADRDSVSVSWVEFQYRPPSTSRDRPPPQVTGIGFYKIKTMDVDRPYSGQDRTQNGTGFGDYVPYSKHTDTTDMQNYGYIGSYEKRGAFFAINDDKPVPLFLGTVGEPIQIQIQIYDRIPNHVEHLSLFTDNGNQPLTRQNSGIEIDVSKGQRIAIHDKNHTLKQAKATMSEEGGYLWINLDLLFQKAMKKSGIILQTWNEFRVPSYTIIQDVLLVSDTAEHDEARITFSADVDVTHDASSPICKMNNSCFAPHEARILRGGLVSWTNNDSVIHTVVSGTAGADTNAFEGVLMPGGLYQHIFSTSGVFSYYCDIHPWATGVVLVYEDAQSVPAWDEKVESSLSVSSTTVHGSLIVENNGKFVAKYKSMDVLISGHLQGVKKPQMINISIEKPDGSHEKISTFTNERGYYSIPVTLAKTWMPGTFNITARHAGDVVGQVTFEVSEG